MVLSKGDASVDSAVDNVLDQWTIVHGQSGALPPFSMSSSRQHEWDEAYIAADIARLNASLYLTDITACRLAVWRGDWLHALQGYFILRLDGDVVKIVAGLRIFVSPINVPRHQGRSRRHSRPRLQTQRRQNNSPPRLERPRMATPTYLESRNRLIYWGQAESVQMDWRRSHGTLTNVWHGISHSPTVYLPVVDVSRLALATSEKQRSYFNA